MQMFTKLSVVIESFMVAKCQQIITTTKISFEISRFNWSEINSHSQATKANTLVIFTYVLTFESTWFMLLFSRHHRFHSHNLPLQHWFIQQVIYGPFSFMESFQLFYSFHQSISIDLYLEAYIYIQTKKYFQHLHTYTPFYLFTGNIPTTI